MKIIKLTKVLFLCLFLTNAQAGIIELRDFNGNSDALVYVEDLNLEFLTLENTAGLTVSQAESQFAGFGIVSFAIVNELFEILNAPRLTDGTSCASFHGNCWTDGDNNPLSHTWLTQWFGITNGTLSGSYDASILFERTANSNLIDAYFIDVDFGSSDNDITYFTSNPSFSSTFYAPLLARSTSAVPEPSALAILGLGLIGLTIRRKRMVK